MIYLLQGSNLSRMANSRQSGGAPGSPLLLYG
jgi:hypothetical protein